MKKPLKIKFIYGAVTVFFAFYALTVLFPFVWAFLCAMRDKNSYLDNMTALPDQFTLVNFVQAFTKFKVFDDTFMDMLFTSLIFTTCGTFMSLLSSVLSAYTIAKYRFRMRGFLYGLAIFIMIVPIVGSMPATYRLVSDLGMKDNAVLISLLYAGGFGMNFIILHGYIKGISWSYAEAGFVDGASDWQIFTRIMIPQMRPALVAVGITTAISLWNDYLTPFLYLEHKPTLAYGIYQFEWDTRQTYEYPVLFAGILLSAIPVLIIFAAFQKTIMENMVAGGLKG